MNITIRLSGESGDGIVSIGDILGKVFTRYGLWVNSYKKYPPALRTGNVNYQLHVRSKEVSFQEEHVDLLIAFSDDAYIENLPLLNTKGIAFCGGILTGTNKVNIPFGEIAKNETGSTQAKNIVAAGLIARLFNLPTSSFTSIIREKFSKKGESIVEKNIRALNAGANFLGNTHAGLFEIKQEENITKNNLILSGNDAIAMGSLVADLKVFAGYPITPATDIMELLAKELPAYGGQFLQTEDEIAALGTILGSSFAGKRSMTSTSGPGLSLMAELIGLAGMVELPTVIVNVQRGGPSTGMPTRVEQGDLDLALYGTHGDSTSVVLAPTTIQDCFYQTVNAFAIAEKFQLPVILLSDQILAQSKETIEQPDCENIHTYIKRNTTKHEWNDYKRYKITQSGISQMSIPGEKGGYYVAQGLEHNEYSVPSSDPDNREKMMQKRDRKLKGIATFLKSFRQTQQSDNDSPPPWDILNRFGHENPKVAIIGWGSSEAITQEAVEQANKEGMQVAAIYPRLLNPLPEREIRELIESADITIVPELNISGQFAKIIEAKFLTRVIRVNKINGEPFYPEDITKAIREAYHNVKSDSIRV